MNGGGGGGGGPAYHGWDKTKVDPEAVRMRGDSDCSSFIMGLFGSIYRTANADWTDAQVADKANEMFTQVSQQLAIGTYSNLSPGIGYSAQRGQHDPDFYNALSSAEWSQRIPTINLWDPFFYLPSDKAQGQTVIGETMHIVMRKLDSEFAADLGGWKPPKGSPGDRNYESSASQYWHPRLKEKCK